MNPGIIVLTLVTFSAIIVLVGMVLRYQQQKRNDTSATSSLKVSELEAIIHRAVEEAVAPLHARIDDLEQQFDASSDSPRRSESSGLGYSPEMLEEGAEPEEGPMRPRRWAR